MLREHADELLDRRRHRGQQVLAAAQVLADRRRAAPCHGPGRRWPSAPRPPRRTPCRPGGRSRRRRRRPRRRTPRARRPRRATAPSKRGDRVGRDLAADDQRGAVGHPGDDRGAVQGDRGTTWSLMATRYHRTPLTVNTFGRKTTHTQIRIAGARRDHVRRGTPAGDGAVWSPSAAGCRSPSSAEQYDVTTETVRRDLSPLERLGLVRRVHGGVVPAELALRSSSPASASATRSTPTTKDRIARAALDQLPPAGGDDPARRRLHDRAGSPACSPATAGSRSSPTRSRSPPRLAGLPHLELQLLPGRVRPTTQAAVGADTVAALADLRVDVAFLGTNGLTLEHGLTTPDPDEAADRSAPSSPAAARVVVPRRLLQVRRRDRRSASPPSTRSTCSSPTTGIADRRPPRPRQRPASRSWSA